MPHRHICDMISIYLGIEPNEVMEGVIDEQLQVELLENFLDKGKTRRLLFFYQDGPPYPIGKNIQINKWPFKPVTVTIYSDF